MIDYHFDYELPGHRILHDDSRARTKDAAHVKGIVFNGESGSNPYYYDLATRHPARARVKRLFDITASLAAIFVLAPLLGAIAAAIRWTSPGPVFFRQRRIGFRGNPFRIYKFRTMLDGAEKMESGNGTPFVKPGIDDPRITPIGRFLRRHSLDELPQLFNVLGGTMSLVGPRPLRDIDVQSFYHGSSIRRFATPPGITGLWQVSGRSECVGGRGLALDREYVDRWSLAFDLEILFRTVSVVLTGRGAT